MIPHPRGNFLGRTETMLFYAGLDVPGFVAAGGECGCQTRQQGGGKR